MARHIAILRPCYLRLILDGSKTVESRLTVRRIPPFGVVSVGDTIHFKASSGPYRAVATAAAVEYHERLTPDRIRRLQRRHNHAVGGDDAYWSSKLNCRHATFITLANVAATRQGPDWPPSHGIAWFVVDPVASAVAPPALNIRLTAGALRNRYLRLSPRDHAGQAPAPGPLRLQLPDGTLLDTALLANGLIQHRGWGRFFADHQLAVGDVIRLRPRTGGEYVVEVAPPASRNHSP